MPFWTRWSTEITENKKAAALAQTTNQPEIYLEAKRERLILQKLRTLPPNVYDVLVRRLVKGDSVRFTAKYLSFIRPGIPFDTARKWLAVLAKDIGQTMNKREIDSETQAEINAFNEQLAAAQMAASAMRPPPPRPVLEPPPGPGTLKRLHQHVTKAVFDLTAEAMLKYAFVMQQKRVDRMMDQEDRMNMVFPLGYKNLAELRMIGEAVLKLEATRSVLHNANSREPIDIHPVVRQIASMDDVDRNLVRQATEKVLQMISEGDFDDANGNPSGQATEVESVDNDAGRETSAANNGIEGNGEPDVAGGAGSVE